MFALAGKLDEANLLQYIDNFRLEIQRRGNSRARQKELGQFFTPIEVAQHMLKPVGRMPESIRILDPGAGAGMLSAAAVSHILSADNHNAREIEIVAYEVDPEVTPFLRKTFKMCGEICAKYGIGFRYTIHHVDFITATTSALYSLERFDLAVLNPPYRKVKSGGRQWSALKRLGLPHSNLYAAFMTLAAILVKTNGQLVSIIPRSFCNGPYYLPFRKALLAQLKISRIHLYDSRKKAFKADGVLQENIILHGVKCASSGNVTITTSDSPKDKDISVEVLEQEELVSRKDRNLVIRLMRNRHERYVNKLVNALDTMLYDLDVQVSTGQVVEYRARQFVCPADSKNSVPLIIPANFVHDMIKWPIGQSDKAIRLDVNGNDNGLLLLNDCYVLVKRFSSKEQRRRLTAATLDPDALPYDQIAIENHVNYIHRNGSGLPVDLAKGLTAYLNSTLADQYFRLFSGHTQVNASDLRSMKYPCADALQRIGRAIADVSPSQEQLDQIIALELGIRDEENLMSTQDKIDEALEILRAIGVPRAQQNNRSALTLLSLVNILPNDSWSNASAPLRGISEMMEFFSKHYGITYAPNTRETVRRYTIHQFWQMGLVVHNPDEPRRPVNSPNYCYQISAGFLELVRKFNGPAWQDEIARYRIGAASELDALRERKRVMERIPVTLPDGQMIHLTAGGQNELIKRIVEEFCPRFTGAGEVLYLGDAGEKLSESQLRRLEALGVQLDKHGKTPDTIVYMPAENWLVLIEAVSSHGPIDPKRHNELRDLFSNASAGLVFVTAFATRQELGKYLKEISWETEVWIAESPDHLIHFDGERFLGPYDSE